MAIGDTRALPGNTSGYLRKAAREVRPSLHNACVHTSSLLPFEFWGFASLLFLFFSLTPSPRIDTSKHYKPPLTPEPGLWSLWAVALLSVALCVLGVVGLKSG